MAQLVTIHPRQKTVMSRCVAHVPVQYCPGSKALLFVDPKLSQLIIGGESLMIYKVDTLKRADQGKEVVTRTSLSASAPTVLPMLPPVEQEGAADGNVLNTLDMAAAAAAASMGAENLESMRRTSMALRPMLARGKSSLLTEDFDQILHDLVSGMQAKKKERTPIVAMRLNQASSPGSPLLAPRQQSLGSTSTSQLASSEDEEDSQRQLSVFLEQLQLQSPTLSKKAPSRTSIARSPSISLHASSDEGFTGLPIGQTVTTSLASGQMSPRRVGSNPKPPARVPPSPVTTSKPVSARYEKERKERLTVFEPCGFECFCECVVD